MVKPKPWRMEVGMLVGLIVGAMVWWSAYEPDSGLMQKPQLLVVPVALGVLVVTMRNKWKRVGPYDPEIKARNKRGPF